MEALRETIFRRHDIRIVRNPKDLVNFFVSEWNVWK